MNWLARLFSPRKAETPPARNSRAPAAAAVMPAAMPLAVAAEEIAFLPWLLGCAPLRPGPLLVAEQAALAALDKTLALPALPEDLLPRAAALIPQLLAMLRQTDLPVPALAQRVAKDVVLSAEVLRLASSPYYRAQGAVTDLTQAIALIGVAGLQTVVARVVLKPIFEAAPGPLSARASGRLWDHAEALAAATAGQAAQGGAEAFDGYLAGLLHGSGWTMALRVLDRAGTGLALPPSAAFAAACTERAHRLFGQAAMRWSITPAFTAFGADARAHPLARSTDVLAVALRQAEGPAMVALTNAATA
jgi:hypothetical protein